jgi:hypothetical protein
MRRIEAFFSALLPFSAVIPAKAGTHIPVKLHKRHIIFAVCRQQKYRMGPGLREKLFLIPMLFACILFIPHSANATRFSGAYLLHLCEIDAKGKETVTGGHAACQSYIAGVLDYHNVLQSLDLAPKIDICVPGTTSLRDLQLIVLKYLRSHGEHDAFIAAPAVTMAIYQAYPCRKGKKR